MTNKLLIALGALLAILVIATIVLVLGFDANRFKPQITRYVSDHYHRTIKIDGDLSLSVFPRIAIAVPAVTLSDRDGAGQTASLADARVSVRLWPLLRGAVEADTVRIDGLHATIVRHADGTLNIDDLLGRGAAERTPAAGGGGGLGPTAVDIGGIEVSGAELSYVDEAAKRRIALHDLKLSAGRIRTRSQPPVELAFSLSSDQPKAQARVELSGRLDLDLAAGRVGADGLSAKVDAQLSPGPDQQLAAKLAASGIAVDPKTLKIGSLDLSADLKAPGRTMHATLAGAVSGALDAMRFDAPKLAGELELAGDGVPGGKLQMPLELALAADVPKQTADATLASRFEDKPLTLAASVRGFSPPVVHARLQAEALDLDALLPPAPAGAKPAAGNAAKGAAGAAAGDTPVDLSALGALGALRLDADVAIGRLRARGLEASDVKATIKAADGRVDIAPLRAKLYQGALDGHASAQAKSQRVALAATLDGVSVGPLLKALADKDLVDGRGTVRLDVASAGATVPALRRGLGGTASLALRDGAIHGIDLGAKLRQAQALIGKGGTERQASDATQKTDFSSLSVSFRIDHGVASSSDLEMKSPLLRVGGEGRIDLGAETIDYTVKPALVASAAGQGGRDRDALYGVTVPVRLTGPLAGPSWTIDWASAGRELLKSKAGEKLREQLAPKLDALKGKREDAKKQLQEEAGKKLLDLFKR